MNISFITNDSYKYLFSLSLFNESTLSKHDYFLSISLERQNGWRSRLRNGYKTWVGRGEHRQEGAVPSADASCRMKQSQREHRWLSGMDDIRDNPSVVE